MADALLHTDLHGAELVDLHIEAGTLLRIRLAQRAVGRSVGEFVSKFDLSLIGLQDLRIKLQSGVDATTLKSSNLPDFATLAGSHSNRISTTIGDNVHPIHTILKFSSGEISCSAGNVICSRVETLKIQDW